MPHTSFLRIARRRTIPFSPVPIRLRFTRFCGTSRPSCRHSRFISRAPTDQRDLVLPCVEIHRIDPHGSGSCQLRGIQVNAHDVTSVRTQELPSHFSDADIFAFASSCENMPSSLIEAMATGLPIACSNRGPMSEALGEVVTYFNPEDPTSIASAILELMNDEALHERLQREAKARADTNSWARSSTETFSFIADILIGVESRR